jgi:cytochrome c556
VAASGIVTLNRQLERRRLQDSAQERRATLRAFMHRIAAACVILSAVVAGACRSEASSEYRPTATVKDIMDSIVDPSADAIWDSVEVIATLEGTVHKAPKTDDDWKTLRRHAIAVVEASNLLLIPGRHVARPGEKAEDARVDLHPDEIEALLESDPAAWAMRAHILHDAAMESLKAIEAHDVNGLMNSGETLDAACESCHRNYWYRTPPPDAAAGSQRK